MRKFDNDKVTVHRCIRCHRKIWVPESVIRKMGPVCYGKSYTYKRLLKEGLTREEALNCVTKNPAEILGINNRVGSLDVGKDADIVIWSDHPFDFYSKVEKVFINGREVYSDKN